VPPIALRPRSPTEIIDAAAQLMRRRYGEIVVVTAIFHAPVAILQLLQGQPDPGQPEGMARVMTGFALTGVQLFGAALASAAIIVVVSDSYLGRPVAIAAAIRRAFARSASVVAATTLTVGIVLFGFVLFIIPGLIFSAAYFATIAVVVIEGAGPLNAMSRARALATGSIKRILAVLGLAGIIVWMVYLTVLAVTVAAAGAVSQSIQAPLIAVRVVALIASVFLFPFIQVVATLLYYDLRIRKEGFDLQVMAEELTGAVPAVA
jgi:uncharacterized membrane protein